MPIHAVMGGSRRICVSLDARYERYIEAWYLAGTRAVHTIRGQTMKETLV